MNDETTAKGPGLIERLLTGFFAGWEPADKMAFCVIMGAFGFVLMNRIGVDRVLDYAFGFLSGRGVGVNMYGSGYQPGGLMGTSGLNGYLSGTDGSAKTGEM